jgi:hypothetical protein
LEGNTQTESIIVSEIDMQTYIFVKGTLEGNTQTEKIVASEIDMQT